MTAAEPLVSVVIPAYFSAGTIDECLAGLRAQQFRDFEVIVVNSSPEEETRRIVTSRYPEVHFHQSPVRLLPHAARNQGVLAARGELLVFTDPDCVHRPDWLERLLAGCRRGHPFVLGAMELRHRTWRECGIHLCKFSWALSGLPEGRAWIAPTANVLVTREIWAAAGPFEAEVMAADALFSWRAARAGFPAWFVPDAIVEHVHGHSVGALWRERLERGAEFAAVRAAFEGWSRARALALAASGPARLALVLMRACRDSVRCGWGREFVATLPVQLVGQLGWLLGETRSQLAFARAREAHS